MKEWSTLGVSGSIYTNERRRRELCWVGLSVGGWLDGWASLIFVILIGSYRSCIYTYPYIYIYIINVCQQHTYRFQNSSRGVGAWISKLPHIGDFSEFWCQQVDFCSLTLQKHYSISLLVFECFEKQVCCFFFAFCFIFVYYQYNVPCGSSDRFTPAST